MSVASAQDPFSSLLDCGFYLSPTFLLQSCIFVLEIQANIAHTSTECLPPLPPRTCQLPYLHTMDSSPLRWVQRKILACFQGQGLHMPLFSHEDSFLSHVLFPNEQFLTPWQPPLVMFHQLSFEPHSMSRPVFYPQMLFSQVVHFHKSFKPLSNAQYNHSLH